MAKNTKSLLRKFLISSYEDFNNPCHIIVFFDKTEKKHVENLNEGKWVPSSEKDYWQRKDTPKFDHEQLHVHIARTKNINTKSKQVSWNQDGTRHDKKTFNKNFNGIETAKVIAKDVLGLPPDTILENIETKVGGLLLESVSYLPEKSNVFIFQIVKTNKRQILKS